MVGQAAVCESKELRLRRCQQPARRGLLTCSYQSDVRALRSSSCCLCNRQHYRAQEKGWSTACPRA
eukprot:6160650-Amphidinium_carterae.1